MFHLRVARLIDIYGPLFVGGGQTHVRELSRSLEKNFQTKSIIFSQPRESMLRRAIWNTQVIPQVIAAHFREPFDLIHSHGHSAGVSAWMISKYIHRPVVHTVHGSHLMDQGVKSFKALVERWALTKFAYDLEISDSQSFLQYPSKAKKITVIPNGVDMDRFKVISQKVATQKKNPVLLFVGRLEKQKGADILIKALAKVKDKIPPLELRLMGIGSEFSGLNQLVKYLGLDQQVSFIGRKDGADYIRELQQADLFILPSLAEGQPISLLDAWAAKLPVIVSDVGHNRYMVKQGKNGFLVKPGKVSNLAATILSAFSHQHEWGKIGLRGYEYVKENCGWDRVAQRVYIEYQDLV